MRSIRAAFFKDLGTLFFGLCCDSVPKAYRHSMTHTETAETASAFRPPAEAVEALPVRPSGA
jgi:hypothetical protein